MTLNQVDIWTARQTVRLLHLGYEGKLTDNSDAHQSVTNAQVRGEQSSNKSLLMVHCLFAARLPIAITSECNAMSLDI